MLLVVLFTGLLLTACGEAEPGEQCEYTAEEEHAYQAGEPEYVSNADGVYIYQDAEHYAEYAAEVEIPEDRGPPDIAIIKTVEINPDLPGSVRIVKLEAWNVHLVWDEHAYLERLEELLTIPMWGEHAYEATITVMCENGEILQRIEGLEVSYSLASGPWAGVSDRDNPLNFHFVDYNGDGYLDMGLRLHMGGSMRNDPHLFWLWDVQSGQFVRDRELEEISWEATVSLNEDGRIEAFTRAGGWAQYLVTWEYIDGEFVRIYSVEYRHPIHENEEWALRITTTNHRDGTVTVTYEPLD